MRQHDCSWMKFMDLKNALLEFMELSDTNYKFMRKKMHFSEFMDLTDTNYKLIDLKMHFWSSWT